MFQGPCLTPPPKKNLKIQSTSPFFNMKSCKIFLAKS